MVSQAGINSATHAPSPAVTLVKLHTPRVRNPNQPLSTSTPRPRWPWPAARYRAWQAAVQMHAVRCQPRRLTPTGRRRTLGQAVLARAAGRECKRSELRLKSKPVISRSGGRHRGRAARVPSLAEVDMHRRSHLEASKQRSLSQAAHRFSSSGPQRLVVLCKRPSNNALQRTRNSGAALAVACR